MPNVSGPSQVAHRWHAPGNDPRAPLPGHGHIAQQCKPQQGNRSGKADLSIKAGTQTKEADTFENRFAHCFGAVVFEKWRYNRL
jgi:hypothetical protein